MKRWDWIQEAMLMSHARKDDMLFPISEDVRAKYEAIKGADSVLLIGLTGGIASGKSTAAMFLKELGAGVIDFDILSRKVVRPDEKAWGKIVEYFGEDILLDNRELDRKKISEIVFHDSEKRKRLEGFTHPAIGEEFVKEVDMIANSGNQDIILVVVPLLIECRMQALFHAIAVVYIPREMQVQRLMERDGISGDMASNIINAQMSIDEKLRHADFVINNSGSLEETKSQVQVMWDRLRERI
jgi:dephospho-CoA kinase